MFLVTKLGVFIEMLGKFPVVFVVTTMAVFNKTSSCVCGDQKTGIFLTVTKWFLCLDLLKHSVVTV